MQRHSRFRFVSLHRFSKDYASLCPDDQMAVDEAIQRFSADPYHASLNTEKLSGHRGIWSIRGSLSLRITFNWVGSLITLRRAANTHDIYKKP